MSRARKVARRAAVVAVGLASRVEAAAAARLGHMVHVNTAQRDGLWAARLVDPRTPGGRLLAGAAGYATEGEALRALAERMAEK